MAIVDTTASTADVDSIAPAVAHCTELPTPVSTTSPIYPDDHQPQGVEALHLDEINVNTRTKIRTLAIVAALYFVLFIAALDQTIIA
jgi:hypothetical protein